MLDLGSGTTGILLSQGLRLPCSAAWGTRHEPALRQEATDLRTASCCWDAISRRACRARAGGRAACTSASSWCRACSFLPSACPCRQTVVCHELERSWELYLPVEWQDNAEVRDVGG